MTLYRAIYFSTITGAIAALLGWGAQAIASAAIPASSMHWLPDTILLIALGVFLGPLLALYIDSAQGRRAGWRSFWSGLGLGFASALIASAVAALFRAKVSPQSILVYRLAVWTLASSIIALGLGLRWVRAHRMRVFHTYAGGLVGGLAGGALLTWVGPHAPEVCQACALMLTGAGTGFGAALSPVLVRDGQLQFISSGDARAQSKYGKARKMWELEHEETYVVGSLATQTGTRFQAGADVFVPDTSISPRHAVLFAKDGRFFVARHPDAGGAAGIARWVLRVRGRTVTTSQELQEQDDQLIGRTALRFTGRRRSA